MSLRRCHTPSGRESSNMKNIFPRTVFASLSVAAIIAATPGLAADGIEAMAFLRREGIYADARRPDLILLDLNLPKMDGREVLALIKKDQYLKIIPTIILTTSDSEADIQISYQLQANCYLRKPAHWDAFDNLVKSINAFWLTRAKLPQMPRNR